MPPAPMLATAGQPLVATTTGLSSRNSTARCARSGVQRGSIYHHFPAGHAQILDAAVQLAGETIATIITRSSSAGPLAVLDDFAGFWRKVLVDSNYTARCPVVSVAVSSPPESELIARADRIFDSGRSADRVLRGLRRDR